MSSIALVASATTLAAGITVAQTNALDALRNRVESGLSRIQQPLDVSSTVLAWPSDDGSQLDRVMLRVTLPGNTRAVALDPDGLLISVRDSDEFATDVPYLVQWVKGDGDALLEQGELALVTVLLSQGRVSTSPGERLVLELIGQAGGSVTVERTLPPILQPLMALP